MGRAPERGGHVLRRQRQLDPNRALVGWYSGDLDLDRPWVLAMFDLTDVWRGTIDFTKLH
ncbi:MAG TPA: hypothetical protein VLM85_03860 [Polyangiaceae bacterium]|nr:hypothetical protein [Polyangiaceae bacterium]